MARIKIDLPVNFSFTTTIPVRITDINYGGHVGNDTVLGIIHEARAQYFGKFGYGELNMAGVGIIMSNAAIEFKNELFYGEQIIASVAAGDFSKVGFDLFYKLEKKSAEGKLVAVAFAKTGIVCYDYSNKKIATLPQEVLQNLLGR
jgi:acyl-CoA thioester hydrolase